MKKDINAFTLKVIAIAAMLINHIGISGLIGYEQNKVFYLFSLIIGKLTFPIMAYLLVEGYHYTSNVKRYAGRLAMFWLLSIVPFWMCFSSSPFEIMDLVNNIMFTLLMGLILLIITDKIQSKAGRFAMVVLFSILTIASDWTAIGVIIIYGFHRAKGEKGRVVKPILYTMVPLIALLSWAAFGVSMLEMGIEAVVYEILGFLGMVLPIPLLLKYNGERGYSPLWVKWGFYAFYPVHLLIIGLIKML